MLVSIFILVRAMSPNFLPFLTLAGAITFPLVVLSPTVAIAQCNVPIEAPARQRRTVEVPDWRVSFEIPENYETMRSGSVLEVLPPSTYASVQCSFVPRPAHNLRPYGVSVTLINSTVTEETIRAQIASGQGLYLGLTAMPSGAAYMHETYAENDLVHLSLPIPGEAATVVFTTNTGPSGEIYQEAVLETILESFELW